MLNGCWLKWENEKQMKYKTIIAAASVCLLCQGLFARPAFKAGYGSVPIDASDSFFSYALQGYGHPAEGRYTLEWIADGRVEVNEPLSFFGTDDSLFALDIGGNLYELVEGIWAKRFSTNNVSLLAGAVPDSYKLICASGSNLYGVSLDNRLSVSSLNHFDRIDRGKVPDAVAVAASSEGLFVISSSGDMNYLPSADPAVAVYQGHLPCAARSAAWYDGRLYCLSADQYLWVCEPSSGGDWKVAGYLNGETWKDAIRFIAVSGGRLYGMGFDGTMYRAECRSRGDLFARTIAIGDGKSTVALVSLDLGAIDYRLVKAIKAELHSAYGLDPSAVLISVTHTHFAPAAMDWEMFPGGQSDPRYLAFLKKAVVKSVGDALESMAPADAGFSRTNADLGFNRGLKGADAVTDSIVDVVDFSTVGGRKIVFFEAACHPVFPNSGKNRFTAGANYPGGARERLEEPNGDLCPVFFQGCCGDTDPMSKDYNESGSMLAGAVSAALEGKSTAIKGRIKYSLDSLAIPVQPMSLEKVRAFLDENSGRSLDIEAVKNVKWARKMLAAYEKGEVKTHQMEYFQIMDIGNWRIVALSREPVKEYALRIRALWPHKNVTVLGYSNDVSSYLTDDKHIDEGSYESHDSFFWYGEHDPLTKGTLYMIKKKKKKTVSK